MKDHIYQALDTRQTDQWGKYLSRIGWTVEYIGKTVILIRKIPLINKSVIKIQHPIGPIPFKKIEELSKKYSALFTLIEPHNFNYSEEDYEKNDYLKTNIHLAHTATLKIDLNQSEEKLLNSFSENARRNIKKAKDNNIVIKKIFLKQEPNDNQFKEFYKLLLELVKIKKFYVPTYEEYYKKMTAFKNTSVLIFAYEKGIKNPVAAVWFVYYKNVITYLQTGITNKGYEILANYLLVWEGLKLGRKLKLEVFDFETIYDIRYPKENKKWIGYSEFKKRFHGEIITYPPAWIKFHNKIAKYLYLFSTIFFTKRFNTKKLKEYKSSHFKKITVWEKNNGEKLLTTNNFPQGISIDKPNITNSYWYKQIELCEKYCRGKKNLSVLFLGLGAGTGPQLLNLKNPKIKQTIIEFDKKIIEICREFFNLNQLKNSTIINADAYVLIKNQKSFKEKFNVIIVDIFTGEESFKTSSINTEFIQRLSKLLKNDGVLIFNRLAHRKNLREETEKLKIFLSSIFKQTEKIFIKDPRGYQNELVIAKYIRPD